jgi:hypothetical protein
MTIALDHCCQTGRHPHSERGLDLYETPTAAVEALLAVETLPHVIWEPAAGRGAIARVLQAHGHDVVASDIIDYGFALRFVGNFLTTTTAPDGCTAILTNPPYQLAGQFVAHALALVPTVVMLLRLAFYESERRTKILERSGLARVHVFRKRLPMMHRAGWTGRRASSAIAFAWFVWQRDHTGQPTLNRISAEPSDRPARYSSAGSARQSLSEPVDVAARIRPDTGVDDCLADHTDGTDSATAATPPGQLELHFDAEGRFIHRCGNCKPPKAAE